ncbi:carbon-nitrogen hydrolase family protein [Criblamydia sequanensis]|uniref:Carbon-nitrogen hydrolase n=1 Tax=Candidatus Criblamydia sequanensis CRIB-18 TaxID=1437425 RepID=A0A090D078_9BACT|nr:carbon-nitrogen hydrolase family protein [Criblamydia sequanensis]CDR34897.1 Carbon-nitrogen hydrolase [Criblamydia sequanensis CRIB-18]
MTIRVAAYQNFAKNSHKERVDEILEVVKQADQKKIDFLCFPEGYLTGYYEEKELAEETALEIEGSEFKAFLRQASIFKTTFIIGFNERQGHQIFDSAAIIEKGVLLGVQRKHFLYHNYFASDDEFSVFHSKGITFGVVICMDSNYFEPCRLLALKGAAILFIPMCNKVPLNHALTSRPNYYSHFVARSYENRCWLVAADWVFPNDGKNICPGHSVIYDPNGCEQARSVENRYDCILLDIAKDSLCINKGRRVSGSPILKEKLNSQN